MQIRQTYCDYTNSPSVCKVVASENNNLSSTQKGGLESPYYGELNNLKKCSERAIFDSTMTLYIYIYVNIEKEIETNKNRVGYELLLYVSRILLMLTVHTC